MKFSVQYTVAHALVHGSVRLNAFLPERLNDPDVRALLEQLWRTEQLKNVDYDTRGPAGGLTAAHTRAPLEAVK